MTGRTVLISGASIAGPALAYWLRRHGFTPTVVERAPAVRPGGQAIDLRGAAREVVGRMGLMPAIRQAHTGVRGIAYVDFGNRRMAAMPADLLGHSGGAIAEIEILRGDLVRILHDATRDDVEYVFGDSVTGLAQSDDGVEVMFERGAPRTFDLVVGADGLRSNTRRLAFGPESRYVRDGGYYQAIFGTTTPLDLDGWQLVHNMPGGRMASLYPTGGDQARAMLFFASPALPYDHRDLTRQRQIIADVFTGARWEVPRLIEAMWNAPDLYFDRAGKVRVDTWAAGRVALLGDAVFAGSVGMGTSMAIVGAYVLAGELAAAGGDHRTAFARYQQEMSGYVRQNQDGGPPGGVRGFLPPTRGEIWLRNQFVRMLPYLPWKGAVTGGIDKAAAAITLLDYGVGATCRP